MKRTYSTAATAIHENDNEQPLPQVKHHRKSKCPYANWKVYCGLVEYDQSIHGRIVTALVKYFDHMSSLQYVRKLFIEHYFQLY